MTWERAGWRQSATSRACLSGLADKLMIVEEDPESLRGEVSTIYEWAKQGKVVATKATELEVPCLP